MYFNIVMQQGNIIDNFRLIQMVHMDNIAAISNKAGNVMAMMPHPERTTNGDAIFQSMRDYIAEGHMNKCRPLHYYPRVRKQLQRYQARHSGMQCVC